MSQTHGTSVFEMVSQVVDETRKKLAVDTSSGVDKTAAVEEKPATPKEKLAGDFTEDELLKVAEACEFLSENFQSVIDDRTPQEKLAEYAAIHDAVVKTAVEGESHSPTGNAKPESDPPKTVALDSSGTGVGGNNAVPSEATNTPGTSLDAGESGEATPGHQSPKTVTPSEKANPQDAPNALETNKEMMMADQPEDILKQSMVAKMSAALKGESQSNVATEVTGLLKKAAETGVPPEVAIALIRQTRGDEIAKIAEDAIFPAKIVAGTEPALQSEPGVPSQLSQGSEVGSNTPRETAPTTGEAQGRQLVANNEAATKATKREAKTQNARSALNELLTEPAMSAPHDKTLQQSLDNTSSAGVKISAASVAAAKEMLRKFAAASPENATKLSALLKLAQDPELAAALAGGGEEAPSDEAIEAASAGVTPEELIQATEIVSAQAEEAAAAEQAQAAAEAEKAGQSGVAPPPPAAAAVGPAAPGAGGPTAATPPPAPAVAPTQAPGMGAGQPIPQG